MAQLTVGPNSTYQTIAQAMAAAGAGDTVLLEAGYGNETATVTRNGMIVSGQATSTGIVLELATGIATVSLAGTAPINVRDAADGNGIVGNDGRNVITVTDGSDAVDGGLGVDRLVVDYRLATGAVTGNSASSFAEAGGSRLVTINGGFEHITVLTGTGADTITTGGGNDIIRTGDGASTVNAGQGANTVVGGSGADTITALDGGNSIDGGDGTNTLTSGGGNDVILSGTGADTIVAGGGNDVVTVRGGADTVGSGAGTDRLIVDDSASVTNVTGGITGGDLATGYGGHIADLAGNMVDFEATEHFTVTTGSGNDAITTGDGVDLLYGGSGNDGLDSGGGSDRLMGEAGNDILTGGAGDDRLVGGLGRDILRGNEGADVFDFNALLESGVGATRDVVTFVHADGDRIDLSTIDADTDGTAGNQAFAFVDAGDLDAAFTGADGELRFAGGFLQGDTDGDAVADFEIRIAGTLMAGDVIL